LGPKKLILLRKPGVEVFGLQGDLEYVPFVPEKSAEVFSKLSEMINGLLAQAIGIEVRNVVIEKPIEKQSAAEAPPPAPEPEPPKDETAEPTIGVYLLEMMNAADAAEFGLLSEAWKAGGRLIDEGKVKDVDRLAWDSYFLRPALPRGRGGRSRQPPRSSHQESVEGRTDRSNGPLPNERG
jgi:hypothetical protein